MWIFSLSVELYTALTPLIRLNEPFLRLKNHDRASKEPILRDEKAVYRRPAEGDHKLQRVQPSRQRVLQVCQHAGEIFLLQTEGSGAYWKVTGLWSNNKGPVRNCRECDFTRTHKHAYGRAFTPLHIQIGLNVLLSISVSFFCCWDVWLDSAVPML